ncbi:MAG TPA: hypothetical protein VFB45_03495 [Pseudolabrys sp.]|nr:hypothetical protein [Pseudolabrys sp.]
MTASTKRFLFVGATIGGLLFAWTAQAAISEGLAKKCRALMIKAHPTVLYGARGTAGDQRAYFLNCVAHNGDMPEAKQTEHAGNPPPTTNGMGSK